MRVEFWWGNLTQRGHFKDLDIHGRITPKWVLTFWSRNYFLNFSTPCIQNVNNIGTKYVRIMKQTAFEEKKRRVYTMFKIFGAYIC